MLVGQYLLSHSWNKITHRHSPSSVVLYLVLVLVYLSITATAERAPLQGGVIEGVECCLMEAAY